MLGAVHRAKAVILGSRKRESVMASNYGLKFGLPKSGKAEVTTRELTITVNGGDTPQVHELAGTVMKTDELVFGKDDTLVLNLVDVDAAGKRHKFAEFSCAAGDEPTTADEKKITIAERREI